MGYVNITSSHGNPLNRSPRTVITYDNSTFYDFYSIGGEVKYRKSTDAGATWGSGVAVFSAYTSVAFDMYYERWNNQANDPIVHFISWTDAGVRGMRYVQMNLSTDVLSKEATVDTWSANPWHGHTTIVVAENGDIHVFGGGGALGFSMRHWRSTDDGTTWVYRNAVGITPSVSNTGSNLMAWPDVAGDTDDIILVHHKNTASLSYHRYDNSANTWTDVTVAAVDTDTYPSDFQQWAMTFDATNGYIYLAVIDLSAETASLYRILGATVATLTSFASSKDYLTTPSLSFLPNGTLLAAYSYDSGNIGYNSRQVYYKTSSDGGTTWGTERAYSTYVFASGGFDGADLVCDPVPPGYIIPTIYTTDPDYSPPGGNDLIEFPTITINPELTGTISMTLTLSGTLTGGISLPPPALVRCKPLDGVYRITGTLDTRKVAV